MFANNFEGQGQFNFANFPSKFSQQTFAKNEIPEIVSID
jgi:hypothetical protein